MSKACKLTIISFVLAAICWFMAIVISQPSFVVVFWVATVAFSITFICSLAVCICTWIAGRRQKSISPYRIFAITDLIIGVFIALYAIYDINTDEGFMAGLAGVLLLVFVVPTVLLLLLADFILWRSKGRKLQ